MKKFILFFAVACLVSVTTANAQKTCSMAKKAGNEKVCTKTAAAKLASLDTSIEKRVCEKSGSVSYVKKNVCAVSGTVSFQDVEYCSKSAKFVNVSPSKGATKASCTKGKASCTKKGAAASGAAMKVSQTDAKGKAACCVNKSKACCASKKASCTKGATSAKAAKAKMVKNEE